jgi:hypothetical protein
VSFLTKSVGLLGLLSFLGCASKDGASGEAGEEQGVFPMVLAAKQDRGDPGVVMVRLGSGICTGSIIGARYVLTAAHCVKEGAGMYVTASGTRHAVVRAHLPTRSASPRHDIAVLEVADAFSTAPIPVNLDGRTLASTMQVRLVGYGVSATNKHDSGIKRSGDAQVTVSEAYLSSVPGTGGTCYGDSGGPALARVGGRETIVGVTSHGISRFCERGSNYVRTDTHRAFLARFVGNGAAAPSDPSPVNPAPINPPPIDPVNPAPPLDPGPVAEAPRPSRRRPAPQEPSQDRGGVSIATDPQGCRVLRAPGLSIRMCS